jgi:hypothetical protein
MRLGWLDVSHRQAADAPTTRRACGCSGIQPRQLFPNRDENISDRVAGVAGLLSGCIHNLFLSFSHRRYIISLLRHLR